MKWIDEKVVEEFIASQTYNIRISGNARWIDQKCTPDVISIIADCIYNYINDNGDVEFPTKEIWLSKYAVTNVQQVFKKPDPTREDAKNEYDKFFQQPMEMLTCAGVLKKNKRGRLNFYSVIHKDILFFLTIREKNALTTLY